jgi:hypothetical protein
MARAMWRLPASVLLMWMLVPDWTGDARLDLFGNEPARMTATRVALMPGHPDVTRVGRLRFLGGVALASPARAFGGYSSLSVVGNRFTLLSDGGNVVSFRMGADWRPRGVRFANLPAGPGTGWMKEDRDSESMARDPATGRIWVGFERWNAIWRYSPGFARGEAWAKPAAMRDWTANGGPESLARLTDGRFLVIAERPVHDGGRTRQALIWPGDPTQGPPRVAFRYRPQPGHNVSDAAELPTGDLVLIERRFRLPYRFTARVMIVPRGAIRAGAVAHGTVLAAFEPPVIHDNLEGVAVTREGGATILWLVSDDNQSMLQRSLLMKFRLLP